MRVSKKKTTLIYQCASEAVMQARIEMRQLIVNLDTRTCENIDNILAKAMRNAGDWAVQAYEADASRKNMFQEITKA